MKNELEEAGITEQELERMKHVMQEAFKKRPPTIGVIGVSGVGKSTTINTLFKTNLPTSDTVRCTTEFEDVELLSLIHI